MLVLVSPSLGTRDSTPDKYNNLFGNVVDAFSIHISEAPRLEITFRNKSLARRLHIGEAKNCHRIWMSTCHMKNHISDHIITCACYNLGKPKNK